MAQLKYHDGDRFRDAPKFRELPEPVGDPLFWWPLHAGYQSETTGFGQGTIYGAQWRRGNYAGGWGLNFDGVDDGVFTSEWEKFITDAEAHSIVLTLDSAPESNQSTFTRIINSTGTETDLDYQYTLRANYGNDAGIFRFQDEEGNRSSIQFNSDILHGEKKRLVFNFDPQNPDESSIWVNRDEEQYTVTSDETPSTFDGVNETWFMNNKRQDRGHKGVLDNVIIYNRMLSEDEVKEDYRRQPWSEVN